MSSEEIHDGTTRNEQDRLAEIEKDKREVFNLLDKLQELDKVSRSITEHRKKYSLGCYDEAIAAIGRESQEIYYILGRQINWLASQGVDIFFEESSNG